MYIHFWCQFKKALNAHTYTDNDDSINTSNIDFGIYRINYELLMNSTSLFWSVFKFQLRCDTIHDVYYVCIMYESVWLWNKLCPHTRANAYIWSIFVMRYYYAFAFKFPLKCFIQLLVVGLFSSVNFRFKWKHWECRGVILTYIFHLFGVSSFYSLARQLSFLSIPQFPSLSFVLLRTCLYAGWEFFSRSLNISIGETWKELCF